MLFVTIPAGRYSVGWRFDDLVPSPIDRARFSRAREVIILELAIATTSVSLESLVGDPYALEDLETLEALCAHVDELLARDGLRLPTEDELEAAVGGALFPWGNEIPDGIPYGAETTFEEHRRARPNGIVWNDDPYRMELTRHALKLGDGGAAICGDYPSPAARLALSPSFRLLDADMVDCVPETLEATWVRPVKLSR